MPLFVVITGPIGAGKSTVANCLAERVSATGRSVAVVDLDDVVTMVRAPLEPLESTWRRARRAHGALTGAWLRSGIDAVIAHGPFYTVDETAAVQADVPPTVTPRRVMLLAPFDVALSRIGADPSRGLSRDPQFLRSAHERFQQLLPSIPPCEWVFDSTVDSAADIAGTLVHALVP